MYACIHAYRWKYLQKYIGRIPKTNFIEFDYVCTSPILRLEPLKLRMYVSFEGIFL